VSVGFVDRSIQPLKEIARLSPGAPDALEVLLELRGDELLLVLRVATQQLGERRDEVLRLLFDDLPELLLDRGELLRVYGQQALFLEPGEEPVGGLVVEASVAQGVELEDPFGPSWA
jgi:hypothetical protein